MTGEPGKILIVDDNATNLQILVEILEEHFELECARVGRRVPREVAPRFQPDLVLLDIMMPGIDGYQTCRKLRTEPGLADVKIIMVSAKAALSERLEGYDAGADDFIVKPFDHEELLSKVRVYMRLRTAEQVNRDHRSLNQQLERSNAELRLAHERAQATNEELERVVRRLETEMARRLETEDRLRHDALHDVLTNLPNRSLLIDRIDRCMARSIRTPESHYALLFLDLDDFKVVNDSLGHAVGDQLLVQIAQRLVSSLRASDSASRMSDGTTARLGGDEFVILLDGLREKTDVTIVAERILRAASEPIVLNGHEIRPKISIGIARGSSDYQDAHELLRDADTALYRAKELGKDRWVIFDAELRRRAVDRLRMEIDLRRAVLEQQLFLQYQPIVSLASDCIVGFEALVRWNHPILGHIAPNNFIPLAETTGLIVPLGKWVLQRACEQAVEWREKVAKNPDLSISVNFSGKQFYAPDIVDQIHEILAQTGLERRHLNIELTESVLIENAGPCADALRRLSDDQIPLHMDDFGTGYSSLSYLPKLPISALKLDRSFVKGITLDEADLATIRAVVNMAHVRGLTVVAEGVETAEQAEKLRHLGCDCGQGYYFSPPVLPEVVERMLAADSFRAA